MEELRNNKYLIDFRKWITKNHSSIQQGEIRDFFFVFERSIEETKNKVFRKYLDNNIFSFLNPQEKQ